MRRKRCSDEQIAFALRRAEGGITVEELCHNLGVSEPTFYRWKKQFAGMGSGEIRRLTQLEEENAKLKRPVADLRLDQTMLQDLLRKNGEVRREVGVLRSAHQVSERRACSATGVGRSSQRYRSRRDLQVALRMRMSELTRCGCSMVTRRLHVLLRRDGRGVNHKRYHRIYVEEGLSIRTKLPRRKRAWHTRDGRP